MNSIYLKFYIVARDNFGKVVPDQGSRFGISDSGVVIPDARSGIRD